MRLGDFDALKETLFIKFGNQLPNGLLDEIDNAPTVKTYCYFCGQTEHGKIEERQQDNLISRSEAEKLGATCLAKRNENGQLEAIISLDNAPTVELATDLQPTCNNLQQRLQGEFSDDYLVGYFQGCKDTLGKFEELQRIQIQIRRNKQGDEK